MKCLCWPICFSPEFLRAKTHIEDLLYTKEMLIGGEGTDFRAKVFDCDIIVTDPRALVIAKYFRNALLATKVNFLIQVYDLCDALKLDYDLVRRYIAQDSRIGDSLLT